MNKRVCRETGTPFLSLMLANINSLSDFGKASFYSFRVLQESVKKAWIYCPTDCFLHDGIYICACGIKGIPVLLLSSQILLDC